MRSKTIKVDMLARVEGEGGLTVKVKDDRVTDVKFTVFEPPRFFEAFLRGRSYDEVVDIVARICGICPVAYQMSAAHAIEMAFGVHISEEVRLLRRLLYCGEWIESHALHVFFLHAPDFLGYQDAIAMAKDHAPVVQKALQLKKVGNDLMIVIGGREIHPISVRVGGFYKMPTKAELAPIAERLKWARDAALEAVTFAAGLPFPDFERDYEYVSLRHETDYPMNEGRLVSNTGLDIAVREYDQHFEEQHVAHSNALHSVHTGKGSYLVGPLARYNLNFDRLSPVAQQAARAAGLGTAVHNPFKSIIVRAVETVYACDEALRIIDQYEQPASALAEFRPTPGVGYACTEAPRGILFHRYRINPRGLVLDAKIVPPTSQNLKMMEADLREYVTPRINTPVDKLTWQCEQVIRNFDPCISCATHFLKLTIERT